MGNESRRKIHIPSGALIVLLIAMLAWYVFSDPMVSLNNRMLQKEIKALPEETTEVALNDLVPFEWDELYTFAPYTTKEEIEQTIGLQSRAIEAATSEGMVQLIFVNGSREKVMASVCALPDALGYQFDFSQATWDGDYCKLTPADNAVFTKSNRMDGGIVLQYTPQT